MKTISVDFDGVIHAYSRGWQGGYIYDEPLPGAIEGVKALMRTHHVVVFTARRELLPVARWLNAHGVAALVDNGTLERWTSRSTALVTNRKFPAVAYVDDRAVPFTTWDKLAEQLADHGSVTR